MKMLGVHISGINTNIYFVFYWMFLHIIYKELILNGNGVFILFSLTTTQTNTECFAVDRVTKSVSRRRYSLRLVERLKCEIETQPESGHGHMWQTRLGVEWLRFSILISKQTDRVQLQDRARIKFRTLKNKNVVVIRRKSALHFS